MVTGAGFTGAGERELKRVGPDALTPALSHGAEGSPQINASTEQSPRSSGERVRVREYTAVVVIPFTLCSLLLCNDMTGERAGVAQSPPPRRPGLPAVNRRFAVPSAYSFRLIGYGRRQRPCKAALSAHPCASPRPEGKRLSDLQPDRGIADSPQSFRKQLYCFCIKNYWGSLSPRGEEKTLKRQLSLPFCFTLVPHSPAQHPPGCRYTSRSFR